jgi:hypothetical protein
MLLAGFHRRATDAGEGLYLRVIAVGNDLDAAAAVVADPDAGHRAHLSPAYLFADVRIVPAALWFICHGAPPFAPRSDSRCSASHEAHEKADEEDDKDSNEKDSGNEEPEAAKEQHQEEKDEDQR